MSHRSLRLWPGVLAVILQWLVMFGLPIVAPDQGGTAIIGGVVFALLVVLWWLFFSRARLVGADRRDRPDGRGRGRDITSRSRVHRERDDGIHAVHLRRARVESRPRGRGGGQPRPLERAATRVDCRRHSRCVRNLTLVRTNGISGDAISDFEWRWTPTAEEQLLASTPETRVTNQPSEAAPTPTPAPSVSPTPETQGAAAPGEMAADVAWPAMSEPGFARVEWPGFRGPTRDSIIRGVRIVTDWSRQPPVELWRRPIGPGWSSFAVAGDHFFTQEQRGDAEIVSAYNIKTGEPVWVHRDTARFWESNAGAGPRATPTLSDGRVYTLGGTGILNALDARDGSVSWSHNAATDTGSTIPDWGIAGSPLVVGDLVVVATNGSLAAYDRATGKPHWFGPKGGRGYSSPHLLTMTASRRLRS